MTLSINLRPETESRLRERAAAEGKDVPTFVQEVIEEKISQPETSHPEVEKQRSEDQLAKFRGWVASHRDQSHVADDSRDAIYGEEEE